LKKTIAIVLLCTYLVISFGYGLSSLGHMWLHAVENNQHLHSHVSSSQTQHTIEDHNIALKTINTESQEVTTQETIALLFTFVFWTPGIEKTSGSKLNVVKSKSNHLPAIYVGRNIEPSTPPPLV
jgi:hypothetical protein